jgi:hypothetical protein
MWEQTTPAVVRRPDGEEAPRLDLESAAAELLAIVRYLTGGDGPLEQVSGARRVSPWHERLLRKAVERLDVIDGFLRGRMAFFVAGREQGYVGLDDELVLAGAALDNCRADRPVIEALLEGRLPSQRQFDAMAHTALQIYPALPGRSE